MVRVMGKKGAFEAGGGGGGTLRHGYIYVQLECILIFLKIYYIPTSFKTPPHPPYRLFDLQDSLAKRIHWPSQLSNFVPLRNGFYSFRAQTD